MKRRPTLAALLGSIYDAGADLDAWPQALTQVGLYVGCESSVFSLLKVDGSAVLNVQDVRGDAEAFALFIRKFTSPDTNPAVGRLATAVPDEIVLREQDLTDAQWHRAALYREVYRPAGLYHGLGAVVLKTRRHIGLLGLQRPRKAGAFTQRELARLTRVLAHLRRAVSVTAKLADMEGMARVHEMLWDRMPYGIALLDAEAKLIWANRAAWTILDSGDGLSARAGRLQAARLGDHAALSNLLSAAIATRAGVTEASEGTLAVSRPSLRRPYALLAAPAPSVSSFVFGRRPAVVVVLTDPEQEPDVAPARLVRLYRLTPREADLCVLLMQGLGLDEIADRLGLSRHTTRQHLRQVFQKTATHRQAELVRLLLRGPAGLA